MSDIEKYINFLKKEFKENEQSVILSNKRADNILNEFIKLRKQFDIFGEQFPTQYTLENWKYALCPNPIKGHPDIILYRENINQ